MNLPYVIIFALMLVPGLIAVAIASPRWQALLWNFSWFLIFAKVGLEAFQSTWGAFPALVFAINYGTRAMRPNRPSFAVRSFSMGNLGEAFRRAGGESRSAPGAPKIQGDVIEAEFHREPSTDKSTD